MSTVAFASGINIAYGGKSLAHTLGFPRQASLRDRSPESSEPFGTLGSFVCTPRDSLSRTISGVCTSFFPSPHLRVFRTPRVSRLLEEFCPTDTPCRETRQHAPASTKKKNRKIRRRAFFRSFHRNDFVYQVVILHRIPSFTCNIKTSEFFFRHSGSCYFGTTVSVCMFGNTVFCMEQQFLDSLILVSVFFELLS